MRIVTASGSLITLLIASLAANAQSLDKAGIEKKLTSEFALTQPTADNTDIVTAGAILVLKKGNLLMAPVSSTDLYQNTYKDGKITQNAFGRGIGALGRFSRLPGASAPSAPATRTYVTGEKMWVTKIEVKDDSVMFDLFTDAVSDVRYKAALKFPFAKGSAPTTDQVDKMVGEVFGVQPPDDASADAKQPAPKGGAQQPPAAAPAPQQAVADAPPPPIAPPPPPPDEPAAPPKSIELGQTKDQVVANFGQPVKTAKVGTKEIYFYKDLKVTFVGGKVTDVQ
jgi:hypothetical protein